MTRTSIPPAPTLPDLSTMDGRALLTLYDAVTAAGGALQGVFNQPRCDESNAATRPVDNLATWLWIIQDRVAEEARARVPHDAQDASDLAWLELQYLVRCQDDLSEVAAAAANLSRRDQGFNRRIAA